MSVNLMTDISIDFYDKKYTLVNAKQLDRNSRFLSITCYNHGIPYSINSGEHAAYIRCRKPDEYGVFNLCDIDRYGKIIVELTEQMLAVDGICCVDLVIVNKGDAEVDVDTGIITNISNASVLSSMPIYIDVSEIPIDNSEIESSYEYSAFNDTLIDYWADFEDVMKTSKSWAVGGTGIRDGEDTDNAKYYSKQSSNSASAANTSASNAANSKELAEDYMQDALSYRNDAYTYMNNAEIYMSSASTSETNAANSASAASTSETNAKTSETNSKTSETNAANSASAASTSETNASNSETNAKTSETNALISANRAQSYAVGGTGTRDGEDTNNSYYYYELIKNIVIGLDTGFIPMGTVSFAELATVEKATGYVYNISDDFVTTEDFREGAGNSYTAGTNVYYTANGEWDCFGGAASPTATVSEIKDYLGIVDEIEITE